MDIAHSTSSWLDQKRIIDHFADVNADEAALRFLHSLDKTIQFIAEFPDLGNPWESVNPRQSGMRYRLVKGFENFVVVYRRYERYVLIIRILHARQDIGEILK